MADNSYIMSFTRFLALMALPAFCLSAYALPADSITVAGRISNITEGMPNTFIINECDLSFKKPKEVYELEKDGSFCQKIPLSYPHTISIDYNGFISAFAAPGDSIYLDIDASTSPLSVTFSGDHAEINQQYHPATHHLTSFYNSVNLPNDTTPFGEFMPVFKEYIRQGRNNIDKYAREHNLSDEVVSMLYADNIYTLANFAMDYEGRNMDEKRAFFLDPVFDIFNEDNTKVMIFQCHISAIMTYFPDVRDNAQKGIIRDLMYAFDRKTPAPERSEFHNQKYYERLYLKKEPERKISIESIKPGNFIVLDDGELKEFSNENPMAWLMNEYKGHPIYLDISATWCGPCRAALKGSESLREHFKDTDIRFAIIWLRSPKGEWLKLAPTISNAIHIFVDNAVMTNLITKHLTMSGFPSYFMIDKGGNITNEGVPRYMSEELPDFLNSYK